MSETEIREPIQKRSIETKKKIIQAGFELICTDGYYHTTSLKIAHHAGVSNWTIYEYFKNKHAILLAVLKNYADDIFFPMLNLTEGIHFEQKDFPKIMKKMIQKYIENHKLSQKAHEELMTMVHSDEEVAQYFHTKELEMTQKISKILQANGFSCNHFLERIQIMIGLIDNLCHEIVYHKHENMDYDAMTDLVIENIVKMLN